VKSVYAALGSILKARKKLRAKARGLRTAQNEGVKFWTGVLTEIKNRWLQGTLAACMGGFPEVMRSVYPGTRVRLCTVRTARNPAKFISYKGLKK
jgi:putative transposase